MGDSLFGRPELTKDMGSRRFMEFYYLDTEMADFCKKNALNPMGDRNELKERIVHFLNGGKGGESRFVLKPEEDTSVISGWTRIEPDFEYGEKHRIYFESAIGLEFVPYEDFIVWLEENTGKTYDEAIDIWFLFHDDYASY